MFRSLLRHLIVLTITFGAYSTANAEILILQSGQKIEGQIIEHTQLRVTVDVQGIPRTFYLGEIASIDGNKIEVMPAQAPDAALARAKSDEMGSLVKYMKEYHSKGTHPSCAVPMPVHSSTDHPPEHQDIESLVHGMHEMIGKMADMNKSVVPTPDGGIIVVSPGKIAKYDKNLNLVKEIDLDADHPPWSK